MMTKEEILALLPYGDDFLFVDQLTELSEEAVQGHYRFKRDEYFYAHHFKNEPITPGVILTECMAQIGLVSLGLYLQSLKNEKNGSSSLVKIAFTEAKVNFVKTVLPGQKVHVTAQKIYWRMGKLKVAATMTDEANQRICYGNLSGMILKNNTL